MCNTWAIRRHYLDGEHTAWMYALGNPSDKDFMDRCLAKDPKRAQRIAVTVRRIIDRGCAWAFASETMKRLVLGKGKLAKFEVRIKGGLIRIAAYLHLNEIPIYLFDFDTHQGSQSNLPRRHIEHALELATIARECCEHYDFSNDIRRLNERF